MIDEITWDNKYVHNCVVTPYNGHKHRAISANQRPPRNAIDQWEAWRPGVPGVVVTEYKWWPDSRHIATCNTISPLHFSHKTFHWVGEKYASSLNLLNISLHERHERVTFVIHEAIMRPNTRQLIQASEKITFNSPANCKMNKNTSLAIISAFQTNGCYIFTFSCVFNRLTMHIIPVF